MLRGGPLLTRKEQRKRCLCIAKTPVVSVEGWGMGGKGEWVQPARLGSFFT